MTKTLAISKRQTQVLLRAAEAENAVVELQIGGALIRLIPSCRVQEFVPIDEKPEPAAFTSMDDYTSWRDRTCADRA